MRSAWRSLALVGAAILVTSCTARLDYTPGIYAIAAGKIRPFTPVGATVVKSEQATDPDRSYDSVHQGGMRGAADRGAISAAIAKQMSGEIEKLGGTIDPAARSRSESPSPRSRCIPARLAGMPT